MTLTPTISLPAAKEKGIGLHKSFNPHHRPIDAPPHVTSLIFLQNPRILSYLLSFLDWEDFYSLLNSCKTCHSLFDKPDIRDVILSRYVSWYRYAVSLRDPLHGYKDVPLSLEDLDLLLMSQRIPLHQYPIHARRVLASSHSQQETATVSSWLRSLTQAHSRFVLLLQAYVHSSSNMVQTEAEDMLWVSRSSAPSSQLRKLTFPAPLSYYQGQPPRKQRGSKNSTLQSQNDVNVRHSFISDGPVPLVPKQARLLSKKRRSYASSASLRRHSHAISQQSQVAEAHSKHWARSSTISQFSRETEYASDDGILTYPSHPKDVSIDSLPYSRSPSGSFHLSNSHNSLTPFATTRSSSGSDSGSLLTASRSWSSHLHSTTSPSSLCTSYPVRMTSPLDLSFAVSRTRAPILRAFVPCTELEDDSEGLLLCEQQLIDAGLWDHLSTGDIVCNLGYVLPSEDDNMENPMIPSLDGDLSSNHHRRGLPPKWQPNSTYGRQTRPRTWLLFNGQFLVPLKPPDAICLPDLLTLPTPFYYMHIMPPYTNPIFIIDGLGIEDPKTVQLESRLIHTMVNVPSPHSPTGRALVRKYAWIIRALRSPFFCDSTAGQEPRFIGGGWTGEWVLEGEGTREGKEVLTNCALGKTTGPSEWEVVVERCGGGRVWLRLLDISRRTNNTSIRDMLQDL